MWKIKHVPNHQPDIVSIILSIPISALNQSTILNARLHNAPGLGVLGFFGLVSIREFDWAMFSSYVEMFLNYQRIYKYTYTSQFKVVSN